MLRGKSVLDPETRNPQLSAINQRVGRGQREMIKGGLERVGGQIRQGMLESLHYILKSSEKPKPSLHPPLSLVEARPYWLRTVDSLCNHQPPLLGTTIVEDGYGKPTGGLCSDWELTPELGSIEYHISSTIFSPLGNPRAGGVRCLNSSPFIPIPASLKTPCS